MKYLLLATGFCLGMSLAAHADIADTWVSQLQRDGYEDISVGRTWLGRIRIVAEQGEIEREIILNRITGEVLRDYSHDEAGEFHFPLGFDLDLFDDKDDDG